MSNVNIYRFKFSESILDELRSFALIHKHEDRKEFKESWINWCKTKTEMLEDETQRLNSLGYNGDVIDKMYKSVRYYFRKKSTIKPEPKKRRKYIKINPELLSAIDAHIKDKLTENKNFKPSEAYNEFYEINERRLINEEILRIEKENSINKEDVKLKIKKTYKNRHFNYIK